MATCWQVLETKARFIWQIMSGQCTSREVEDVSETVLSMAEIKALASGNPKVLDRVKLQNEISKLEHLYHAWLDNRAEMRRRINRHGFELQKSAETITFYEQAIQARDAHPVGDDFKMAVRGTVYTERKAAGEAINRAAEALIKVSNIPGQETRAEAGEYRGFKIILKVFPEGLLCCGTHIAQLAQLYDRGYPARLGIYQAFAGQHRRERSWNGPEH